MVSSVVVQVLSALLLRSFVVARLCCYCAVGAGRQVCEALHVPGVFEHAPAERRQHLGAGKSRTVVGRHYTNARCDQCNCRIPDRPAGVM